MRRKPPKDWFSKSLIVISIQGLWVGEGHGVVHGFTREQGLKGFEVDALNDFTSWLVGRVKEKPSVSTIRQARDAINRTKDTYAATGAVVEDWRIDLDKVVQEFDVYLAQGVS
jgi:hypothetical protein